MNGFYRALWKYWDKPQPKARLNKVEPLEVSNHDALIFGLKFIILALAIFFAFLFGGLVL